MSLVFVFFLQNFFFIKERLKKQLRSKGQKNTRLFYSEKFETTMNSKRTSDHKYLM